MGGALFLVGWVDGLHTEVEAQDEEIEIETKSQSIRHGNLLEESVEPKLSAGLVGIVAQCPDVSRIDKQCAGEFPKQSGPVLHVQVELHVASLVDEVDLTVLTGKAARTEPSDRPTSHTICSAREIALLEGEDGAVAIGIGNTESGVEDELVVVVKPYVLGVFHVGLDILRIGNVEYLGVSVFLLAHTEGVGKEVEQVARSLHGEADGMTAVVVCPSESQLHDEEVLVVVSEDGIAVGVILEIVVAERVGYPRHEHVVEVEQVEPIAVVVVGVVPLILPR